MYALIKHLFLKIAIWWAFLEIWGFSLKSLLSRKKQNMIESFQVKNLKFNWLVEVHGFNKERIWIGSTKMLGDVRFG